MAYNNETNDTVLVLRLWSEMLRGCTWTSIIWRVGISKLTDLWKYSTQESATPSWMIPIACISCCLVSGVDTISNSAKKWLATATRASLGQRWNQSMVQPEINPGNFRALCRNFSPTWNKTQKQVLIGKDFLKFSGLALPQHWEVHEIRWKHNFHTQCFGHTIYMWVNEHTALISQLQGGWDSSGLVKPRTRYSWIDVFSLGAQ